MRRRGRQINMRRRHLTFPFSPFTFHLVTKRTSPISKKIPDNETTLRRLIVGIYCSQPPWAAMSAYLRDLLRCQHAVSCRLLRHLVLHDKHLDDMLGALLATHGDDHVPLHLQLNDTRHYGHCAY